MGGEDEIALADVDHFLSKLEDVVLEIKGGVLECPACYVGGDYFIEHLMEDLGADRAQHKEESFEQMVEQALEELTEGLVVVDEFHVVVLLELGAASALGTDGLAASGEQLAGGVGGDDGGVEEGLVA